MSIFIQTVLRKEYVPVINPIRVRSFSLKQLASNFPLISKGTRFAARNLHRGNLCKTFQHKSFPWVTARQPWHKILPGTFGIKFFHYTARIIWYKNFSIIHDRKNLCHVCMTSINKEHYHRYLPVPMAMFFINTVVEGIYTNP